MLIYGKNSIMGALSAEHPVEKIIFESGSDKDDRIRMIKDIASRQKVPMEYRSDRGSRRAWVMFLIRASPLSARECDYWT